MELTKAQQEAVYSDKSNILVSAGAGSGKTSVLAGRIARLIAEGRCEADEIIAVTFTKSAAANLKSRVRRELMKLNDKESRVNISGQLAKLELALICTIDSLCKRIIDRYYHIIGVDPAFGIMASEEQQLILMDRAAELLYEELLEEKDEKFIKLEDMYSFGYESNLTDIIIGIYSHIQNKPQPLSWLREASREFALSAEGLENTRCAAVLEKYLSYYVRDMELAADEGRRVSSEDAKSAACFEKTNELAQRLRSALSDGIGSFFKAARSADKFPRFGAAKSNPEYERLKLTHKKAKDAFSRIREAASFSYEKNLEMIAAAADSMEKLTEITERFSGIYTQLKRQSRLADFSDLAHGCLEILNCEEAAHELNEKYKYVFIDEYQDTNSLQEAILLKLSGSGNLFAVGDVKQSIYRFRNAEPELFLQRQELCEKEEGAALIRMRENFRSAHTVTEAVNVVFDRILTKDIYEIDYANDESMTAGVFDKGSRPAQLEIAVLENEASDSASRLNAEASHVARLVEEILEKSVYDSDTNTLRRIRPEEIAIIGRRMNSIASYYTKALKSRAIPYACLEEEAYFDALEVALVINLLKLIDNSRDDIALLSVMRSFIYGFCEDELVKIRAQYPSGTYRDAVKSYEKHGKDGALRKKISRMTESVLRYRDYSRAASVEALLTKIYADTGLAMYVSVLEDGTRRTENLRDLITRAAAFEQGEFKGLYGFILYLEKLKTKAERGKRRMQPGEGKVNLMTVHAAKGLEFEAVIVVDCARPIIEKSPSASVYCHKDVGLCPVFVSDDVSYKCDTVYRKAAALASRAQERSEEARILYVAATRAKQLLYFTGAVSEKAMTELASSPKDMMPSLSESVSFLKWIYFALAPDGGEPENTGVYETQLWRIKTFKYAAKTDEENEAEPEEIPEADEEKINEIKRRVSYVYPYESDSGIPTKVTVSELKEAEVLEYRQKLLTMRDDISFDGQEDITGARAGSALHTVMQHLREEALDEGNMLGSVEKQIKTMTLEGILSEEEAQVVDAGAIASFFESEIGTAMLKADEISKETPFIMEIEPSSLDERWKESSRKVMLQGVIDCYFVSDSRMYLIDYKTDKYINDEKQKITDVKYTRQLKLYAQALKELKGKEPDECCIAYISQKRFVKIY